MRVGRTVRTPIRCRVVGEGRRHPHLMISVDIRGASRTPHRRARLQERKPGHGFRVKHRPRQRRNPRAKRQRSPAANPHAIRIPHTTPLSLSSRARCHIGYAEHTSARNLRFGAMAKLSEAEGTRLRSVAQTPRNMVSRQTHGLVPR